MKKTSLNITVFLFALSLVILSCQERRNEEIATEINKLEFISFLEKENISHRLFKKIIIVPNVGCSGCISDAERSFIKNYKKTDTLYIFTAINDLKLFKNSLPQNALNNKNVIIDTNNTLISLGFNSIYPSTIEINRSEKLFIRPY